MGNYSNLNLSNFSKELGLLLEFLKDEIKISKELLEDINWDLFLQLARHHRVYSIVYKKAKEMEKWVPSPILQALQRDYQRNTFQMLRLFGEMEQLSKVLAKYEIRSIFLKGPILATELYGDLSLRTSSDIDVLIPLHDLDRVETILVGLGFMKDDYILTVLSDWKWRHHHITFFHPQKGLKVEIHWRLNPGPAKEPSFNAMWERKRRSSITAHPIYFLGEEDLFLFLVSHGARHGWSRLRWLVDIHQMVKKDLKWDQIKDLLRKFHCLHVGGQALILSSHLLDTQLTKIKDITIGSREKELAQQALFYIKQMVNLHAETIPEEVSRYHKRHLFELMSYRQRLLFLISFLYPFAIDAETLPLPKPLHFLYFPLRPFLCAWRKTRKQALP